MVLLAPEAPSLELLPERMRAARRATNLTQADLARVLEVSLQVVRAWEQSVNVPHGLYARAVGGWLERVERDHPYPPPPRVEVVPEGPPPPERCPQGHSGRMAWQGDRYRCRECDRLSRKARRAARSPRGGNRG